MTKKSLTKLAQKIIRENKYLSLGTYGKTVWVSVVYYCIDNHYNFYYASKPSSVHTKNILKNKKVAWAIFDSTQKEGTGVGVQIAGKAVLLSKRQMKKALRYYHSDFVIPEMLGKNGMYRLFKLVPRRVYVTDPNAKVDRRVEVVLQKQK